MSCILSEKLLCPLHYRTQTCVFSIRDKRVSDSDTKPSWKEPYPQKCFY